MSESCVTQLNGDLMYTNDELTKCQCANEMLVVEVKSLKDEVRKMFQENLQVREVCVLVCLPGYHVG